MKALGPNAMRDARAFHERLMEVVAIRLAMPNTLQDQLTRVAQEAAVDILRLKRRAHGPTDRPEPIAGTGA